MAHEYVLMAPKGFDMPLLPNTRDSSLLCADLKALSNMRFVIMKKGRQLRVMQDRIFQDHGFCPNVILETDNWQTSLRMVENGVALTILPNDTNNMVFTQLQFDKYALEKEYRRRTFLCYRKNAYLSRLLSDFILTSHRVFKGAEL